MITLKMIKKSILYFCLSLILHSCAQSHTPELTLSCAINLPLQNSDYSIKILAGKYDTINYKDKKIYNITFYPVNGGHTIIFGKKFNDRNGYTSPRLIIFKDSIKYKKFSYNDIIKSGKIKLDSLEFYQININ